MSRTVRVTAGDRDHVYFDAATVVPGEVIRPDATVVVGFGDLGNPPANPITPDGISDTIEHPAVGQIRVGLFVASSAGGDGAHVVAPGDYTGWLKLTESPASAWISCGPVTVI